LRTGAPAPAIAKLNTIAVRQTKRRGLYGDGLFLQVSASGKQRIGGFRSGNSA
jgi:hypothetical protein